MLDEGAALLQADEAEGWTRGPSGLAQQMLDELAHRFVEGCDQPKERERAVLDEEDLPEQRLLDVQDAVNKVDDHELLEHRHHVGRNARAARLLINALMEPEHVREIDRSITSRAAPLRGIRVAEHDLALATVEGAVGEVNRSGFVRCGLPPAEEEPPKARHELLAVVTAPLLKKVEHRLTDRGCERWLVLVPDPLRWEHKRVPLDVLQLLKILGCDESLSVKTAQVRELKKQRSEREERDAG